MKLTAHGARATLPWLACACLPGWAATCPDLSALQRAAGFVTWQNLLQVAGVVLAAAGTLFFASGFIRRFLQHVQWVEAALWTAGAGALGSVLFVAEAWRPWPVLFGCLLLPGAAIFSMRIRLIEWRPRRMLASAGLFWALAAIAFQSTAVGFLAVACGLALLGLFIAVVPCGYVFGFDGKDALVRGTLAGALMVSSYTAVSAAQLPVGPLVVFRPGALWLGGLAWYLGVLISSSKFHSRANYPRRQWLALAALAGSLTAGLLLGVRELTVMAGTFLLFFLAGKLIELPFGGRIAFGLKLLAAGGLLFAVWWATANLH